MELTMRDQFLVVTLSVLLFASLARATAVSDVARIEEDEETAFNVCLTQGGVVGEASEPINRVRIICKDGNNLVFRSRRDLVFSDSNKKFIIPSVCEFHRIRINTELDNKVFRLKQLSCCQECPASCGPLSNKCGTQCLPATPFECKLSCVQSEFPTECKDGSCKPDFDECEKTCVSPTVCGEPVACVKTESPEQCTEKSCPPDADGCRKICSNARKCSEDVTCITFESPKKCLPGVCPPGPDMCKKSCTAPTKCGEDVKCTQLEFPKQCDKFSCVPGADKCKKACTDASKCGEDVKCTQLEFPKQCDKSSCPPDADRCPKTCVNPNKCGDSITCIKTQAPRKCAPDSCDPRRDGCAVKCIDATECFKEPTCQQVEFPPKRCGNGRAWVIKQCKCFCPVGAKTFCPPGQEVVLDGNKCSCQIPIKECKPDCSRQLPGSICENGVCVCPPCFSKKRRFGQKMCEQTCPCLKACNPAAKPFASFRKKCPFKCDKCPTGKCKPGLSCINGICTEDDHCTLDKQRVCSSVLRTVRGRGRGLKCCPASSLCGNEITGGKAAICSLDCQRNCSGKARGRNRLNRFPSSVCAYTAKRSALKIFRPECTSMLEDCCRDRDPFTFGVQPRRCGVCWGCTRRRKFRRDSRNVCCAKRCDRL